MPKTTIFPKVLPDSSGFMSGDADDFPLKRKRRKSNDSAWTKRSERRGSSSAISILEMRHDRKKRIYSAAFDPAQVTPSKKQKIEQELSKEDKDFRPCVVSSSPAQSRAVTTTPSHRTMYRKESSRLVTMFTGTPPPPPPCAKTSSAAITAVLRTPPVKPKLRPNPSRVKVLNVHLDQEILAKTRKQNQQTGRVKTQAAVMGGSANQYAQDHGLEGDHEHTHAISFNLCGNKGQTPKNMSVGTAHNNTHNAAVDHVIRASCEKIKEGVGIKCSVDHRVTSSGNPTQLIDKQHYEIRDEKSQAVLFNMTFDGRLNKKPCIQGLRVTEIVAKIILENRR
jgi:hypothetical protein